MTTNDVKTNSQPSMTELVKGIANDIGDLVKQEIRFARTEIKSDLRKARRAGAFLVSGIATALVGTVLFSLMIVHFLHWLASPTSAVDPSKLPLWGCYGLTSILFLGAGAFLAEMGLKKLDKDNPLPVQTVKTVEENVSWITNSK
jgi:uncharacterized membrane protein YqjE